MTLARKTPPPPNLQIPLAQEPRQVQRKLVAVQQRLLDLPAFPWFRQLTKTARYVRYDAGRVHLDEWLLEQACVQVLGRDRAWKSRVWGVFRGWKRQEVTKDKNKEWQDGEGAPIFVRLETWYWNLEALMAMKLKKTKQ